MPTIFLSYRRSDTGGEAGRLVDTFQQKCGDGLTFRDVSNIPLGERFDAVLREELSAAKTVLVLIGPTWLTELRQRLTQSDVDYLRVEVSTALATRKRLIPILLKGAALPTAQDLPQDIDSLAKCQAMTLRDESWSQDTDRLLDAIGRPYSWKKVTLRAGAILLLIVAAVKLLLPLLPADLANDIGFLRILMVSLTGTYAFFELCLVYRYVRKLRRRYEH
jgi:TIR domain